MKNIWVLLLLLVPTLGFSQHEQMTNEGYNYEKPATQLFDPDLKKYEYPTQLGLLENKDQLIKKDPHLAGEKIHDDHFEPEVAVEPDYKTHTIVISKGKGHYEYTATECNKDCSSEKWTPEILKAFHGYIQYLGLTVEEFVSRYVLSSFYNPQE